MGPVLLIERCIVLLLAHRGSQGLRTGTIQHAVVSRRALQDVVVNRAHVTIVKVAMIHARLGEMSDRWSTLHLATEVCRTTMHLVLNATKTSNVPTSDMPTPKTASANVPASKMAAATDVTTADVPTSHMAASAVAMTGRQALNAEQGCAHDETGG